MSLVVFLAIMYALWCISCHRERAPIIHYHVEHMDVVRDPFHGDRSYDIYTLTPEECDLLSRNNRA
jgi:hypothetical protein